MKILEGKLSAEGKKFAIVASRFNDFIVSKLIEGAKDCLIRHGADDSNLELCLVPGAFELPYASKLLAKSQKYDAIICLGAVIRGATPHFDYVCSEATKGIAHVGLECEIPISFGLLTTNTIEEAIERAGTKAGNKGFDAAMTAIEMTSLSTLLK